MAGDADNSTGTAAVPCAVYRSPRKADNYLYVRRENDFSSVPQQLLDMFGSPELVLTVELTPARRLAQADVIEVISALQERGYYLQLPPTVPHIARS